MKSINVRKIGAFVSGAAMLGAALAAPVSAGIDMTGIDKGFFYDTNFNPLVQIVVGEGGMASDAIAAGNIAATVGNLAYTTKVQTLSNSDATGQVTIETAEIGAKGDYVQDSSPEEPMTDFYDADDGFKFDGQKTYEKGDFTQYSMSCDQVNREDAGILLEGTFNNIHCLFCKTLCVEGLKNPSHEMKEKIYVDSEKIKYYEEGINSDDSEALRMSVDKNAIKYIAELDYIPLEDMAIGTSGNNYADFQYRGKVIFMGKEYYFVERDGDKIILSDGKVLDDITSEGYTSEYKGYKFKIDHLIYSGEYVIAGIYLDVQLPDGTIKQVQISKMANGRINNLEIAGVYAEAAGAVETASIIVYDTATRVVLEDGEDLEVDGVTYEGWKVSWEPFSGTCDDLNCDISKYQGLDGEVLEKIEVTQTEKYTDEDAIGEDESLQFPSNFLLTFKGYMTNNYKELKCSGGADKIKLTEGDEAYQLSLSFTGDDGNRYDDVRMDEGPYSLNKQFISDGTVWEFDAFKNVKGDDDKDDTVEITKKPLISGNKQKITVKRYCDPEDTISEPTNCSIGSVTCNCEDVDTLEFRTLALVDATDDEDVSDLANDDIIELDPTDLYWGMDGGKVVYFDDGDNKVLYATSASDRTVAIEPSMVGQFKEFDADNTFVMETMRECNIADIDSETRTVACDYNNDVGTMPSGNDDDLLVTFTSNDERQETVVVDMSDRGYNELERYQHMNSVGLYSEFGTNRTDNGNNLIMELNDEQDSLLITPLAGDAYTVDWGVDTKVDGVSICHPTVDADSTYFIGTDESTALKDDIINSTDVGKEVTAGCCTFKVKEFSVTGNNVTYTQTSVNKVIGQMVISEAGADTSKNLIIVGGPAVNGMCTVTRDEIDAAAEKFVVKKDGNLLIVAGWDAADTTNAGNRVVDWLNTNVHA